MNYEVTAEDRNRMSQGIYAYCRGLDRFDRDLALSPFTDDAHLVYSGIFEGTPPEFMDWIWPIHARMPVHVHRVTNIFIERHASGSFASEAYVQVLLRTVTEDGSITDNLANGRYIDRWADVDGRLLIVERDYIRDSARAYPHEPKDLSSVRPVSTAPILTWARDASDASYRLLGSRR